MKILEQQPVPVIAMVQPEVLRERGRRCWRSGELHRQMECNGTRSVVFFTLTLT